MATTVRPDQRRRRHRIHRVARRCADDWPIVLLSHTIAMIIVMIVSTVLHVHRRPRRDPGGKVPAR
jgi:hypothetical protein